LHAADNNAQHETPEAGACADIRKEYARKMEYLAPVHDGSTGQVHAGYWLCAITGAEVNGGEILPLYQKLYSAEAKDFTGENAEVLSGVDQVRAYTGGRGIWTMDRGGDRKKLLEPLLDRRQRFVIRSTGKRWVWQVILAHLWQLTLAHLWRLAGQGKGWRCAVLRAGA
jgi:hypothetical protein